MMNPMTINKKSKTPIVCAFGTHFQMFDSIVIPADKSFFQTAFDQAVKHANGRNIVIIYENGPTYDLSKAHPSQILSRSKEAVETMVSNIVARSSTYLNQLTIDMSNGIRRTDAAIDFGFEDLVLKLNSVSPNTIKIFFEPQIISAFWPYFNYIYFQSLAISSLNSLIASSSPKTNFRRQKMSSQEEDIIINMEKSIQAMREYHKLRDQAVIGLSDRLSSQYPDHLHFIPRGAAHTGLEAQFNPDSVEISTSISPDFMCVRGSNRYVFNEISETEKRAYSLEELFFYLHFKSKKHILASPLANGDLTQKRELCIQVTHESNQRAQKAAEAVNSLGLCLVDAYSLSQKTKLDQS